MESKSSNGNLLGKIFINILKLILVVIFIYSAYNIIKIGMEYYKNQKAYKEIQQIVPSIKEQDHLSESEYNNLKGINKDFVFWIKVPGTNIDYPVVQATNNEEYLYKNFNGEYNKGGSIFVDSTSDINNSNNVIIHGHNMKDNSMFGSLKDLNNNEFLKENNKIYLYNSDGKLEFQIYSVYVENASDETYKSNFADDNEFETYIDETIDKSFYNLISDLDSFKTELSKDKIITLSTCKNATGDERLIVQAKLIK